MKQVQLHLQINCLILLRNLNKSKVNKSNPTLIDKSIILNCQIMKQKAKLFNLN